MCFSYSLQGELARFNINNTNILFYRPVTESKKQLGKLILNAAEMLQIRILILFL